MPLTDEQASAIKKQLLQQVSRFPKERQEEVKKYITSMNNQQLEDFLKQNKVMVNQQQVKENQKKPKSSNCVFCSIANKEMDSFAIYEDKDYLGVLELNPFSQGHILLIPKKHIKATKSLSSKAYTLANKIGKHLVKQLKTESFQVNSDANNGHAIINIIPIYKNKELTYERTSLKPEELKTLAIKIGEVKKRAPPQKKSKKKSLKEEISSIIKLSRRIP